MIAVRRGSSVPPGVNAVTWTGFGPAVAGSTKDWRETPSGNEVVAVAGAPAIATVDVEPSETVIRVIGTSVVVAPARTSAVRRHVPAADTARLCPAQLPSGWRRRDTCVGGRSGCVTERSRSVTASAVGGTPVS